jgi:hypothetical protein
MSVSAKGAEKYFDEALKKSDYYAKELGVWGGRRADRLCLKGEVTRGEFLAFASNKLAGTGEKLTVRTTGNIVYAVFVHTVSRPIDGIPDPHAGNRNGWFSIRSVPRLGGRLGRIAQPQVPTHRWQDPRFWQRVRW